MKTYTVPGNLKIGSLTLSEGEQIEVKKLTINHYEVLKGKKTIGHLNSLEAGQLFEKLKNLSSK